MMRTILFILSLFCCMTIDAQELTVKSFAENARDLSARTEQRVDNNGVPCALVKVQLASAGAVFEGMVMGDVAYKTSEYWVYMPKGAKRLGVKLEGYLPLLAEFSPLESNMTYVLTISGVVNNAAPQQEVRTKTGWIIIDSDPQGAAVYINDGFVGNTPLDGYKQAYGSYSYRLEKLNYHNATGTFMLDSPQYEKTITLSPACGSITVSGNVSGAEVLLDGRSTGKRTPCTLTEVPSGPHVISLQKEKYAPMQYNVTVEDGLEAKVNANLDARFASVTINTLQGAEVYVDNKKSAAGSCTVEMMEGYHDVEATLAHHRKATKQLQVIAGQPQTITINPTPIYGSLDIISTPRKATITIDGKQVGETPFTVENLLEGEHTVTLSLDGYSTETKRVTVTEGQNASVSVEMQQPRVVATPMVVAGNHEYVDLGLSVKWATCNVGASKPWEYGDYYAWGETETKSDYSWETYKYCKGTYVSITKYCKDSKYGTVDNKTQLDPQDDVAHVKWGGSWRMPTMAEQDELVDKCIWSWTTQNGVKGYKVTSTKNGNSVFLPAAGYRYDSSLYDAGSYGYYWSSSLGEYRSDYARYVSFKSSGVSRSGSRRYYGRSVRPVCP